MGDVVFGRGEQTGTQPVPRVYIEELSASSLEVPGVVPKSIDAGVISGDHMSMQYPSLDNFQHVKPVSHASIAIDTWKVNDVSCPLVTKGQHEQPSDSATRFGELDVSSKMNHSSTSFNVPSGEANLPQGDAVRVAPMAGQMRPINIKSQVPNSYSLSTRADGGINVNVELVNAGHDVSTNSSQVNVE